MKFDYIGGIMALIMGLVILIGSLTTTHDISSIVVGALFTIAGAIWIYITKSK